MIPNVFVSSTIADLQHLRSAVRETILELGYSPVMSEYGDIGYLPSLSAESSCYVSMKECDFAILIIGKRYGSLSSNNNSITHNEFMTARELGIPVFTLVEKEVLSFMRVYDANSSNDNTAVFPGMDAPGKTFAFLHEIMSASINNGVLAFETATEARAYLKKQIAHFFGNLLNAKTNTVKGQLVDVLSEIKTLRHELLKDSGQEPIKYLKAAKFLLKDRDGTDDLKSISDYLFGGIDSAIPLLLESTSLENFFEISNIKILIEDSKDIPSLANDFRKEGGAKFIKTGLVRSKKLNIKLMEKSDNIGWLAVFEDRTIEMNSAEYNHLNDLFQEFKIVTA